MAESHSSFRKGAVIFHRPGFFWVKWYKAAEWTIAHSNTWNYGAVDGKLQSPLLIGPRIPAMRTLRRWERKARIRKPLDP